jgi:probable HAF family extracellular repeat protein
MEMKGKMKLSRSMICAIQPLEDRKLMSAVYSTIVDLGTLPGGTTSSGENVNSSAQVAGESSYNGLTVLHAFISNGTTLTDLGTLGGNSSVASTINNAGEIVGYSSRPSGNLHAFLYNGGSLQNIGTFGGTTSIAYGISPSGEIVGYATLLSGAENPFSYTGGVLTNLGTLGGINAQALSINASGQITGFSETTVTNQVHAFLDTGGNMLDLGTLGGIDSQGEGLNNSGQVVGFSGVAGSGNDHAFLYSGGSMTDLGTLGGAISKAYRINGTGQIVGQSQVTIGSAAYHAFVVSNGKMIDLNSLINPALGWVLQDATGINNAGQITGYGTINGQSHAFLLTLGLPTFTSASSANSRVGVEHSFTITATGSPTVAFKEIGDLPAGLSFVDNGDGTAVLSGTPAANSGGVYILTIRAKNGVRPNATQLLTLTVH